MSHELRTPMHAILSYSEFGLKKCATARPEKLEHYFSRINSAGERLLGMINDLLDLAKAESGRQRYEMRRADLAAPRRHQRRSRDELRLQGKKNYRNYW